MSYLTNRQFPVEDAIKRLDVTVITADYTVNATTDGGKTFWSGDGGVNKTITLPESPAEGFQIMIGNGFQGRTLSLAASGSDVLKTAGVASISSMSTGVAGFTSHITYIGNATWHVLNYGVWTIT